MLVELADLIGEKSAAAKKKATSMSEGSSKKHGRRSGGNLDKIMKAVGKQGSRIKDIAEKISIAAPTVSNYISNNPSVFVKSRRCGVEVILK